MHIFPQKKSNVTVEELFELYVGEYHPELKPTTVQQYRFLHDYYLKNFIGKVKLKNRLLYHIQKVYNHFVEKKMKPCFACYQEFAENNAGVFYIETPKTRKNIRDIYLVPEAEEAIKSQLELRKIIVEPIQEDIKDEFENLLFVNTKGKPVNVGSARLY